MIDTGFNLSYNLNAIIPGVRQSSRAIRDNFSIIKRAIENLQSVQPSDASIFDVSSAVGDDGAIALDIGFRNNSFVLPVGDPTIDPVAGMVRYHGGSVQFHDGSGWAILSAPTISSIVAALASDPDMIALVQNGNLPDLQDTTPDGVSGLLSGADKTKLDALAPAFTSLRLLSDNLDSTIVADFGSTEFVLRALAPLTIVRTGTEVRLGIDIPKDLVVANGAAGFMSGTDKAKLDQLITTNATTTNAGYMSGGDKLKLDQLASSFTQIAVNNGPILASSGSVLSVVASSGISVNAIPGQQKLSFTLTSVGGVNPTVVGNAVTAFNNQRSRVSTPISETTNEQISHSTNANATVDILFTWDFSGLEAGLDGFRVTVNETTNSQAYALGSSLLNERVYDIPTGSRSFTLRNANPTKYFTFFVQGFRKVDADISASGVILGNPRKITTAGKNPYRPETLALFSGSLGGAGLTAKTVGQIFADIDEAKAGALWSNISGAGKPQDGADVTSEHTALNTRYVNNLLATEVTDKLSSVESDLVALSQQVLDIDTTSEVGGVAIRAARDAAIAASVSAQSSADQVNTQYNAILGIRTAISTDTSSAVAANTSALAARDAALLAASNLNTAVNSAQTAKTGAEAALASTLTAKNQSLTAAQQAQLANEAAMLSVAQARPFDFTRQGLFWDGLVRSEDGATYQTVAGVGPTFRQHGPIAGWITHKKKFLSRAARRIRAIVRCRYYQDAPDTVGQTVTLTVKGVDDVGNYVTTTKGNVYPVAGYLPGNDLFQYDGWQEFAIDFIADDAFADEFTYFSIWFEWNTGGAVGTIEISTFMADDITESGLAAIASGAAVAAQNTATTARDQAVAAAASSASNATTATTASNAAQGYRNDAATSAATAQAAGTTAATNAATSVAAAQDAQAYRNDAAGAATSALYDADRAESSAGAVLDAAQDVSDALGTVIALANTVNTQATTVDGALTTVEDALQAIASSVTTVQSAATTTAGDAAAAASAALSAQSYASQSQISASASASSQLLAQSYMQGAATSASASATHASTAQTYSDLATSSASASELSRLSVEIAYASLLPSNFLEGGRYWSLGATGTPQARLAIAPRGTFVANSTYGLVFQSRNSAGDIAPVGALALQSGRSYKLSISFRATTQTLGASAAVRFYAATLDSTYATVLKQIDIHKATTVNFQDGWKTYSKIITVADFGTAPYLRPVFEYNQTEGLQTIQIREIRVDDVTESQAAGVAAAAAIDTQRQVTAYRNETIAYASAVEVNTAQATTAAGTAVTQAGMSAQSAANALGYSVAAQNYSIAAAASDGLASTSAQAAAASSQQAAIYSSNAYTAATAAESHSIDVSVSGGAVIPAGFANDDLYWSFYNATYTFQNIPLYGRTARLTPIAPGPMTIRPLTDFTPYLHRKYRLTVLARVYQDGTDTTEQVALIAGSGQNPAETGVITFETNTYGALTATIDVSTGWKSFSADLYFSDIATAKQMRLEFRMSDGPDQDSNAIWEISLFKLEDITLYSEAKVQADSAATSADLASSYKDEASSSATSATESANTSSVYSERAVRTAAQTIPYDFTLDGIFFTNDLSGADPADPTVGSFVTVT